MARMKTPAGLSTRGRLLSAVLLAYWQKGTRPIADLMPLTIICLNWA